MLRQRHNSLRWISIATLYPVRYDVVIVANAKTAKSNVKSLTSLRCEPTLNLLPHIHVKAAADQAKFWLDPLALAANYGFAAHELNEIERIVMEHQTEL